MINLQRRNFLWRYWRMFFPPASDEKPDADAFTYEKGTLLPPEFSPGLLRLEGQRLGLPVDTMSEEALSQAVAQVMRAQTRSPAGT